jgi:hypothetical protein
MTEDELVRVTGKRRHSKQAEWFKLTFGVDVVRAGDGKLIVTWATFEALNAKKNGLLPAHDTDEHVELCL